MKPGYIVFLSALAFYSCRKDIQVNLNDAAPQIVITGNVTNAPGPYQVSISKTVNFSAPNTFPAVTGAAVAITDNTTGQTDSLTETSPGLYTTQGLPQGLPGHTYLLDILAEGQRYTASSTMPQPVLLDSVSFEHNSNFGSTRINAVPNYRDPAGVANYYTFTEHINGVLFTKTVFALDDRLSDGRYMTRQLFMDSAYLAVGDQLTLDMNCVDKPVFNYFNTLANIIDANNFQSASPANPVSNLSNNALGYFSANTTQTETVTVK